MQNVAIAVVFLAWQGSESVPTVSEITSAMEQNYAKFRSLSGITISYTMLYEHRLGHKQFTEPRVEVVNARSAEKVYGHVKFPGRDSEIREERYGAWNESVGTDLILMYGNAPLSSYKIRPHASPTALNIQYYSDRLFYPEGRAKTEIPDSPIPVPGFDGGPDYWLPEALSRNAVEYHVLPQRQTIDGAECLVLERPKRDRLWLDPALGYAIRRRDFRRPDGTLRDRVLLKNFAEAAPALWLPQLIVHEQYCGPGDPPDLQNKVSGVRTLQVNELKVAPLPDEQFIVPIPEGARVSDMVRNINYDVVRPGDDPIARAEAEVRRQLSGGRTWPWVVGIAAGVSVIVAAWGVFVYRRR